VARVTLARLATVATLVALSGCALLLPPRCKEGTQIRAISTDLGPIYVCEKPAP
jgi:hypothetical protein